jgi:hypothetical protein
MIEETLQPFLPLFTTSLNAQAEQIAPTLEMSQYNTASKMSSPRGMERSCILLLIANLTYRSLQRLSWTREGGGQCRRLPIRSSVTGRVLDLLAAKLSVCVVPICPLASQDKSPMCQTAQRNPPVCQSSLWGETAHLTPLEEKLEQL